MVGIELNQCEQRIAKYLARARYEAARSRGIEDKKIGPQSNEETDLEGIAAEIAFCKIMNVYPDTQVGVCEDADALTVELGGVDVKATKHKNGRLLAVRGKVKNPPDSYALMIGEFPTYRFVGWASADDLLDEKNLKDLGWGLGFALEQSELNDPLD